MNKKPVFVLGITIFFIIIIVLLRNLLFISANTTSVIVRIPDGSSAEKMVNILFQNNVIHSKSLVLTILKLIKYDRRLQSGAYNFPAKVSLYKVMKKLITGDTYRIKITIPEGLTMYQIAKIFDEKNVVPYNDFVSYATITKSEGYLFPETYFFDISYSSAEYVIKKMREQFDKIYNSEMIKRTKEIGFTQNQVVILASLIEKETRNDEERTLVSSVFHNRLKKRWDLESCATVQYVLALQTNPSGHWKQKLSFEDLKINSPYNTYKKPGLPPGPICNPGLASLRSALYPVKSDAMFFVADGTGSHVFSRYYTEHLKNKYEQKRKQRSVVK